MQFCGRTLQFGERSRLVRANFLVYGNRAALGEAKIKQSATQKLIAQFPLCCFCGGLRPSTTREHMPPKALFDNSHRPDCLVMPACDQCNRSTSLADLTTSVISRWSYPENPKAREDHRKLVKAVRENHPELADEWAAVANPIDQLRSRFHLENQGVPVPPEARMVSIGPLTIRNLNLFAHKATLALYFEHFRRPLPNTGCLCAFWRTKEDVAAAGVPKIVLDIMTRYATLEQGAWNERDTFEYRYELNQDNGLFAFMAKLRNTLYVIGFAATDSGVIPEHDKHDWMRPQDLLDILDDPKFLKRL
jgi:hypothetical protein